MIKIQKSPVPDCLITDNNKWKTETDKAIQHYSGEYTKSFDFSAYSDPELKKALKMDFKDKCAYCESYYGAVYDGDIEHFRPKGKVAEKSPQTPGYYWLANDWTNLLLSCQHCNQRRNHEIQIENNISIVSLGKLDQFPLKDESKRVNHHAGNIEEEERLLINPCIDNPIEYFEYDEIEGVIKPIGDENKRIMSQKSIEIYALQQTLLVQNRKRVLLRLREQIIRTRRAMNTNDFDNQIKLLNDFALPQSEYAGMCRFFIVKFLKDVKLI
jgi:uncharacterized protein (TIGR02646 family)